MKQLIAALGLSLGLMLSGCGGGTDGTASASNTGMVALSLTDAPTDHEEITGVFVTFTGIKYKYAHDDNGSEDNESEEKWQQIDLNESRTIDLLTLQDGNTTLLQHVELPAGEIEKVRFVLDTTKCYIEILGEPTPLNVPGGEETGLKSTNGFIIPQGGTVNLTADFDVRKSIAPRGHTGLYNLRPTIRLVNNIEVGEINGTVNVDLNGSKAILYAYSDGTWDDNETNTTEDGLRFTNAVVSTEVKDGEFALHWLTTGIYDLVLVEHNI
ncbi:MAG TPA: DUF4382 domain-containing protein, partial [Epsilonproteobacteria bacterium]|nr:DUF4382 domain-containing protein [Campylobacterota bacterium]